MKAKHTKEKIECFLAWSKSLKDNKAYTSKTKTLQAKFQKE